MKIFPVLFLVLLGCTGLCQELPPIVNYSTNDYNAENQNWDISQSSEKLIYVANNEGLLEFNGARWQLYPSPNQTILRSVRVVNDRIYTGCFMEFGYWHRNDIGTLNYTSLSKQIDIDLKEDEEFWNILYIEGSVVFQSLKRIYIYNITDESFQTIDSNSIITKIYTIDENIYFQKLDEGIFKIENGKEILFLDDEVAKNKEIINIFIDGKELLFLTKDNGFYNLIDHVLVKSNIVSNDFLSTVNIYDGIRLIDNGFAIGTISNGVIYLDKNGEILFQINHNNGLSNNTVLALFEDIEHNTWLGLDNGISYINKNAPYKVFNNSEGNLGSIYTSIIFNDKLYLGTNQGLFYKSLNNNTGYSVIDGTQGQVWCLKEIDNTLFCGHNSGIFLIDGTQKLKIPNIPGTWNIAKLNDQSDLLLIGNYDGLSVLEKTNNTWKLKNKIKGFNNSSRYFETLENKIFVNHEYKGIYVLNVDNSFSEVLSISVDTLLKGSNSGILKYNGDILYSYKKGIFKYDPGNEKFIIDTILSNLYTEKEYQSGKLNLVPETNKFAVFTKNNISFISSGILSNVPKITRIPLAHEMRNDIVGYENIMALDDQDKYLIGTASGYIIIDPVDIKSEDFQVYIDYIESGTTKTNLKKLNKNLVGDFNNNENDFDFFFYVPQYKKYEINQYQYQLTGVYDQWTNWSAKPNVSFQNLPFGNYTFKVRAKIGNTLSKNIESYSFTIAKPWYITDVMISLYVLGIILLSLFTHMKYKKYYSKQRKKLIKINKQKLLLAKIRNEKEVINIEKSKLEFEFKSKNKELAVSTMSLIKKNELLINIKDELLQIPDKKLVKPIINIINKSLNHKDDWEFFQEAFNNMDSEFLKNIKKKHPNISPSELKLCAYLRLNLSSKEIAPLLYISKRSVEIKRYRLRKNLGLSHDQNLVGYILEL